jgi:hypothetical protein
MTKKPARKPGREIGKDKRSPANNVFLTLTLVPLVIGILLIVAWGLDFEFFDWPQAELIVGIMFLLMAFAASNAVLKKWRLAIGWGLLMLADLAVLAWLQVWAQIVAIIIGLVGLGFLLAEFYTQYTKNKQS